MTRQQTPNEARSEDLRWFAEHWETPKEAARRLGLSLGGLAKWCADHDPEVLERLRENQARRDGLAVWRAS